jgi:predicted nucleotide-binding protein
MRGLVRTPVVPEASLVGVLSALCDIPARVPIVRFSATGIRILIVCSTEALPIARAVQNAFASDPFTAVVWTDGVFRVTNYPLEILEAQIDDSDFAIAIAHADDSLTNRGKAWPRPRDNIIFELGLFMGRLGRSRAILMEPRAEKVRLPSDFAGVTTITYRFEKGADVATYLAPACYGLSRPAGNNHALFGPS